MVGIINELAQSLLPLRAAAEKEYLILIIQFN